MIEPDGEDWIAAYVGDNLRCLLQEECKGAVPPDYMSDQQEITGRMRSILVDWLVEVHAAFKLQKVVLFSAVNLVDRYLMAKTVTKQRLQLVGVTALLIAAKFEDTQPPRISACTDITAGAYNTAEIREMETRLLEVLGFRLECPSAGHLLPYFQVVNRLRLRLDFDPSAVDTSELLKVAWFWPSRSEDETREEMQWYLLTLALMEMGMLRYAPSRLAAAALLLGNRLSGCERVWSAAMTQASGYTQEALQPCVEQLMALHQAAPSSEFKAIEKMYGYAPPSPEQGSRA